MYYDYSKNESYEKIAWDAAVDTVFITVNVSTAAGVGAAIGTAICPGPGSVVGFVVGAATSMFVENVLNTMSAGPRR